MICRGEYVLKSCPYSAGTQHDATHGLAFEKLRTITENHDSASERLRRWTRNPLGSACRGSNPLAVVLSALRWICATRIRKALVLARKARITLGTESGVSRTLSESHDTRSSRQRSNHGGANEVAYRACLEKTGHMMNLFAKCTSDF